MSNKTKKLKPETEALLRRMCMEQKTNKEIAAATGLPLADVHAWRSRNNLTRAKVEELLERECDTIEELLEREREAEAIMEVVIRDDGEEPENVEEADEGFWIDDTVGHLLQRTDGTIDSLVKNVLTALKDDHVCDFCKDKKHCDLLNCAPALAEFLRKEFSDDE